MASKIWCCGLTLVTCYVHIGCRQPDAKFQQYAANVHKNEQMFISAHAIQMQ